VFENEDKGVIPSIIRINGQENPNEIINQAMKEVNPLLK
jgi:hypothetical protein